MGEKEAKKKKKMEDETITGKNTKEIKEEKTTDRRKIDKKEKEKREEERRIKEKIKKPN